MRDRCWELGFVFNRGVSRRLGQVGEVHFFFHGDLAAQKSAFFGGETLGGHITVDPARGADLQLFRHNRRVDRARDDDRSGLEGIAGHPAGFTHDHQTAYGNFAFEGAFNSNTAFAAQIALPVDAGAENGGDPFDRSDGSLSVGGFVFIAE